MGSTSTSSFLRNRRFENYFNTSTEPSLSETQKASLANKEEVDPQRPKPGCYLDDDGWVSFFISCIRVTTCFWTMMITTFIWALIMLVLLPWPYQRIRQGNVYGHVTGRLMVYQFMSVCEKLSPILNSLWAGHYNPLREEASLLLKLRGYFTELLRENCLFSPVSVLRYMDPFVVEGGSTFLEYDMRLFQRRSADIVIQYTINGRGDGGSHVIWILGNPVRIEGSKFSNKKAIYISNHASPLDIFLIMWLTPTGTVGIAKKEIVWYPLFGQLYVLANHLRIDRSNPTAAVESMKKAARAVVENNLSLIIFPEGTRSKNGRLLPFKKGFVHLALQTRLPIIPIVLTGTHKAWRKGGLHVRPAPLTVKYLPPIKTDNWMPDKIDDYVKMVRDLYIQHLPEFQRSL